jgi:hypothetical protein
MAALTRLLPRVPGTQVGALLLILDQTFQVVGMPDENHVEIGHMIENPMCGTFVVHVALLSKVGRPT